MDDQPQALVELDEAQMAVVNGGGPGTVVNQGMCDDLVGLIRDVIAHPGA
jgi:hypothetical protein